MKRDAGEFFKLKGVLLLLFALSAVNVQSVTPSTDKTAVITKITNPAMPGKLSVIVGDGWAKAQPDIMAMKLNDNSTKYPSGNVKPVFMENKASSVNIIKNDNEALVGEFPAGKFSVYAVSAKGAEGWGEPVIVNAAHGIWLSKESARSGDTLRLFGRNLVNLDLYPQAKDFEDPIGYGTFLNKIASRIVLEKPDGDFLDCKVIKNSAYDVHFILPAGLNDGAYNIYAHNGLGGEFGWSGAQAFTVKSEKPWPDKVFNVMDYGATGHAVRNEVGWNNDAPAIQKALDAAGANGGGVVYFPPGNYYLASTISISPYTVMKGESRERCWLWFDDANDHGKAHDYESASSVTVGVRGITDFTIENLSIHSVYTNMLIAAPMSKDHANEYVELDSGKRAKNITIRNCYLAHEPMYHYHYRKKDPMLNNSTQNDESWGMKATVSLRGDNISITNNRIRGGGMGIAMLCCTYSRVADNEIIIGRSANAVATRETGYPEHPRPQKLILEDNRMWPATAAHHSGFWSHATSGEYYVARNDLQLTWGADFEGLLWHGWGPEKAYEVESATKNTITVKTDGEINADGWECIISKGKGLGQRRMIKEIRGGQLILDEDLKVIPEEGSRVALAYYHTNTNHIIVDNKLSDTGAGIFAWGNSCEWIIDGNTMTRGGGVMFDVCAYTPDRAWSGNYFSQTLNNKVDQGRYNSHIVDRVWTIGYSGTGFCRDFNGGVVNDLGLIFRNNLATNDSAITFWERVEDKEYNGPIHDVAIVAEDNKFKDCMVGIGIGDGVSIVLRDNLFKNVIDRLKFSPKSQVVNMSE